MDNPFPAHLGWTILRVQLQASTDWLCVSRAGRLLMGMDNRARVEPHDIAHVFAKESHFCQDRHVT